MNLNYSAEVCGNLTLDIHNETQVVMVTATVLMLLTALYPRRRPRSMSPQFKLTTACFRICLLLYLSFLLVSSRSFTYYLLGALEMTELPITSHCKRRERELDHCIDKIRCNILQFSKTRLTCPLNRQFVFQTLRILYPDSLSL